MTGGLAYVVVGIITGLSSGFLGIGGGLIVVPALVYLFGLTQHQAQGTSLAMMIPPITLLAAIRYFHSGNVKLGMAVLLACGFAVGGLLGAHLAQNIPGLVLRRIFGAVMLVISVKMIFMK